MRSLVELSHAGASMDTLYTLRNTTTPFTSTPLTAALFFVLGTWEWTHLGLYTAVLCSISSALLFVLLAFEKLTAKAAVLYVSVGNHYSALYLVLYLMPSLAQRLLASLVTSQCLHHPVEISSIWCSGKDQRT